MIKSLRRGSLKLEIRSSVSLNTKRPEDLLKKEGKLYLKEEIRTAINSFLIDGNVVDVFYIGFQIN
jgi:flagellar FliL protein